MTTALQTDEQIRQLVREMAGLRADVRQLRSEIEMRERRRRIDREIHVQMIIIIVSFGMMGVMMAIMVLALR